MSEDRQERLSTRIHAVADHGDHWEILMPASPVRYRLCKENTQLITRLKQAIEGQTILEVLVDWQSSEVLAILD